MKFVPVKQLLNDDNVVLETFKPDCPNLFQDLQIIDWQLQHLYKSVIAATRVACPFFLSS